jgi:hypothetical protein
MFRRMLVDPVEAVRCNDEADAEILSSILNIISDKPSYVIDASGASGASKVAQRDNHL